MQKFTYQIHGSRKKTIVAKNKEHALAQLRQQGISPSTVTFVSASFHQKKQNRKLVLPFLKRLLQLHEAGLPIGDTLRILQTRLKDPQLRDLAIALWKDLSEGKSLGSAMKSYPHVFSEDIIYPLEAAESTGNLAPVLRDVIRLLTEREQLKKKIVAGMAYPVFVTIAAMAVVVFFLFFLLPRIEGMLTSMGGHLTLPARILIGFSNVLLYGIPLTLIGSGCIAWILRYVRKHSPQARQKTDRLLLAVPMLGTILQYTDLCRVSNLLATLLKSSVNLTEAMRLTERTIRNSFLRAQYQEARNKINDGAAITNAFQVKKAPLFTDLALDIIMVGENTGNLHESFQEVYNLHNQELDTRLHRLTTLITSGALGFAFFLVAILALGIVSSIMQFTNTIKL